MIDYFQTVPFSTWVLIIGIFLFLGLLSFWQLDKSKPKFSLVDLITNPEGRIDIFSFGHFVALILSSWVFVKFALQGTLSEAHYLTYMTIWAGATLGKSIIGVSESRAKT
jgi:hypothetical protein